MKCNSDKNTGRSIGVDTDTSTSLLCLHHSTRLFKK